MYDPAVLWTGLGSSALLSVAGFWWASDPRGLLLGFGALVPFFAATLAYPPARRASLVGSVGQAAAFAGVWLLASAGLLGVAVFSMRSLHGDVAGGFVRLVGWMLVPCFFFLGLLYLTVLTLRAFAEARR